MAEAEVAMPGDQVGEGAVLLLVPQVAGGLPARLDLPRRARGLAILALGASSTDSAVRLLGRALMRDGYGVLRLDLLTPAERETRGRSSALPTPGEPVPVPDAHTLATRLLGAIGCLHPREDLRDLPVGLIAGGLAESAALHAASTDPKAITALVLRGDWPGLPTSGGTPARIEVPLLVVTEPTGGDTLASLRDDLSRLPVPTRLRVMPGPQPPHDDASAMRHLAALASQWFAEAAGLRQTTRAVRAARS